MGILKMLAHGLCCQQFFVLLNFFFLFTFLCIFVYVHVSIPTLNTFIYKNTNENTLNYSYGYFVHYVILVTYLQPFNYSILTLSFIPVLCTVFCTSHRWNYHVGRQQVGSRSLFFTNFPGAFDPSIILSVEKCWLSTILSRPP